MKNTSKKFSIVIPTRDRLDQLKAAINSILQQDYQDYEIVIADNSTNKDIENWILNFNDSRIRYFPPKQSLNVTENWNRAINLAEGEYILMLGDDDVLVPKGLSILQRSINQEHDFDCAYLGCYLFAMPEVFPGESSGFLRSYENRSIYGGRKDNFILDKEFQKTLVNQCFDFIVAFDYNPQFWLLKREFVLKNFANKNYYQGPYPDYFAAIATMIKSEKVLVIPEEIVVIGITKVSHGFFHFAGDDDGVLEFQNFEKVDPVHLEIQHLLIPITFMPTLWAVTLEYLSREYKMPINWKRYRKLQMIEIKAALIEKSKIPNYVTTNLKFKEKFEIFLFKLKRRFPSLGNSRDFALDLRRKIDTHPIFPMPNIEPKSKTFDTISTLFHAS
jgi:glycosyltransferase involved in cell wall biosynthesis